MKRIVFYIMIFFSMAINAQLNEFNDYLSFFKTYSDIQNGIVLKGQILPTQKALPFLPMDVSPCSEGGSSWYGLASWEINNYFVVIARRDYEMACETEKYPWGEYWLISYTATGEIVDYCHIGCWGDRYLTEVKGNGSLLSLFTIQASVSLLTTEKECFRKGEEIACNVNLIIVDMDNNGHFLEKVIGFNEPGYIIFDEETADCKIRIM